jgi:dihydrolipoamide dehydrogenase
MTDHDLLVIGGGAGNNLAMAASRRGLDVGLVERGPLGGACLTRGCDPSKTLLHRADIVEQIRRSDEFGIDADVRNVDFDRIIDESNRPWDEKAQRIEENLRNLDGFTLYKAEGRFVDDRTLDVGGEQVTAEKVILAVGARPMIPSSIDGIDEVDYVTSDEALRLDERPDHLVLIGGGYVAAELGYFYGAMGADVTIIGRSDRLISDEDTDVSETFTDLFAERYSVHTGHEATAVEEDDGQVTVRAESNDGDELSVTGDELLVATGRVPNTDVTNVEAGGIETDEKGFVETNEYLETSAENVWSFGDAIGGPQFRHTANHESQAVFRNAVRDRQDAVDYTGNGHAIFSSPEVASVGQTEQELEEEDRDYATGRKEYSEVAMGMALKDEDGFVKVLADPDDGEILGCHVLGSDASTLVHEVAVAVTAGDGTVADVEGTIHIHPALSEVVEGAFENVSE